MTISRNLSLLAAVSVIGFAAPAQAQTSVQRVQVPNRVQPLQETAPTIRREALDLVEEEAEEMPSSYTTTCRDIEDLLVGQFNIRLQCRHADEYGIRHYYVRPGSYDRETPQENSQRWYATRFIEAVQYVAGNSDVDLTLTVIPTERYGAIADSFTLSYRD